MEGGPRRDASDDWQPATSKPGEVFTPEGRIAAMGAFARGFKNHDPRSKPYRRSMMRVVYGCLAFAAAVIVLALLFG